MAEVNTTGAAQPRKQPDAEPGGRRKRSRPGVRIDMTPMVDVAFLLLIFFMLTAVFRRPLAMEVNLPEPGAKVQVPESNVMTVLVESHDEMFYRVGKSPLQPLDWQDLTQVFRAQQQANPEVIILVKIARDARYEDMVDMMDALDEAGMERFSLVPMTDQDAAQLEGQTQAQ